jgi:hypothetical protein
VKTHKPTLLACLLGFAVAGPIGCANQQSPAFEDNSGMNPAMQPLQIDPALEAQSGAGNAGAQTPPVQQNGAPWPRQVSIADGEALIYLPQINSWTGNQLSFRAAVSVKKNGANEETFGVVWGTARTDVDRATRTVSLAALSLSKASFPTAPDNGLAWLRQLRTSLPATMATMSLDLLQGELLASQTAKPAAIQVNNAPPRVIVSDTLAILVPLDGAPSIKPVPNTRFERVINSQALIVRAKNDSTWYLHVFDGWLSAASVAGPWVKASAVPPGLDAMAKRLANSVDLLDGGPQASPKPSLNNGVPTIYVTQEPAELIVFKGQPNFVPITGTGLLWAENTTANVLVNTANNDYYVLLSGRWYRAAAMSGPWTYVPANALPADFSRIPKSEPAGVILAAVAGTPQAQEALIANTIPHTAQVPLANGPKFTPVFDGAPQFKPVDGTPLQYVINASVPIIGIAPDRFYAVEAGVWFTAPHLTGPWIVAKNVPEVIYSIPPSSPLHYVTYVHVYGSSDQVVYVGYTPGYLGNVVTGDGVVVYGTGYYYTPWIGSVWYASPYTWGLAAAPIYNPYVGYAYGFGLGLTTAAWATPYWGGGYYHPGNWGAPCCGSTSANVYGRWGNTVYAGSQTNYAGANGRVATTASGNYANLRTGTTGAYAAGRAYNPTTGQAVGGYDRTFNTAGGTSGNVARGATYNTQTGQGSYAANVAATGPGGDSISRTTTASANPQDISARQTTTFYNANTGQSKSYSSSGQLNDHYAGADGNAYRNTDGGWQQHTADGWQSANGDNAWAEREQQARSAGGGGGFGQPAGNGGFENRFGGGGFGGRFGGGGGFRR